MTRHYFSPAKPRLFAHRGLAHHKGLDENTIEAFSEAIKHGATHLESDTQATKDDVAVLLHDQDLKRVAGIDYRVSELTLGELQEIPLTAGGRIPTLSEALNHFPAAFFNLDIKTKRAIDPTIAAIEENHAHERVLISSFSNPVRKSALEKFSRPVATSGSVSIALAAWASHKFLFGFGLTQILKNVDALQVPVQKGLIRFAEKKLISRAQKQGTEIHFWTINEPAEMKRLLDLGADGIVTDRADLFHS
ncbi:MAG: glycerophosphodiester phosphodiesterase family protein [bacterium]